MSKNNAQVKIAQLRKKIDQADKDLLRAFGSRFKAVTQLGVLKKKLKLPVVQKARWQEVMNDRLKKAKKHNISPVFTKKIYELIHQEAIRIQKKK